MARYFSDGVTGPQFQIRLPRDLASHFAFSSLSVPLTPAPKLQLRRRALKLASAAQQLFVDLRAIDTDDLKTLPRSELVKRIGAHCDRLAGKDILDDDTFMCALRDGDVGGFLSATAELLSRPSPITPLTDRMKSLPIKGLIILQKLHEEGAYLVDAEFDACLAVIATEVVRPRLG